MIIVTLASALSGCVSISVLGKDCQGWHLLRLGEPTCSEARP